ncbi:hypothetical protein J6590_062752 [Homalodisca vitripennis]|nr:hypothetical protein J6590_062752 [Homalodisca vitripennis]
MFAEERDVEGRTVLLPRCGCSHTVTVLLVSEKTKLAAGGGPVTVVRSPLAAAARPHSSANRPARYIGDP